MRRFVRGDGIKRSLNYEYNSSCECAWGKSEHLQKATLLAKDGPIDAALISTTAIDETDLLSRWNRFAAGLDKRDEAIRSASIEAFFQSARPQYIDVVNGSAGAQAEVQAQIIIRHIA